MSAITNNIYIHIFNQSDPNVISKKMITVSKHWFSLSSLILSGAYVFSESACTPRIFCNLVEQSANVSMIWFVGKLSYQNLRVETISGHNHPCQVWARFYIKRFRICGSNVWPFTSLLRTLKLPLSLRPQLYRCSLSLWCQKNNWRHPVRCSLPTPM